MFRTNPANISPTIPPRLNPQSGQCVLKRDIRNSNMMSPIGQFAANRQTVPFTEARVCDVDIARRSARLRQAGLDGNIVIPCRDIEIAHRDMI
ncbi:hypothetical protein AA103581_0637 [Gluconobacter wancherniae NBRC 103581]|nr:hypothetical protein AA103581_0637 [Gluconobacter wancherniae NBRC 103581]